MTFLYPAALERHCGAPPTLFPSSFTLEQVTATDDADRQTDYHGLVLDLHNLSRYRWSFLTTVAGCENDFFFETSIFRPSPRPLQDSTKNHGQQIVTVLAQPGQAELREALGATVRHMDKMDTHTSHMCLF